MEQPKKKIPIHVQSSQNRILIKGGKCVNVDHTFDADVFIEDGIIKKIGPNLIVPGGVKTIDARGHYVMPGGIDPHTHLEFSFFNTKTVDDFYSGSKAALSGGTTTIIDSAISKDMSLVELYEKYRSLAENSCCDYALHIAITSWKDGVTDKEMAYLVKEKGINSFKCFMSYKDYLMLRDDDLLKVFETCKRIGALPMVHAENGDVIEYLSSKLLKLGITGPEGHLQSHPEDAEAEATNRAITLANHVNVPLYIVHVMSKLAAKEIVEARSRGALVFGEVLAAGIGTDGSHYFNRCWRHAAGHVLSPPLRNDKETPEHLINLLSSGQLETLASDHCVFSGQQKSLGKDNFTKIPSGVNGVEERLIILWEKAVKTGKMDPCRFVAVTSANAAKLFNIYPRKGKIAVGSDADIIVWGKRPKVIKAESHTSLVDFNIFEGTNIEHGPVYVIANGKIVVDEDGGLHVAQGAGRFIQTPRLCQYLFSRVYEKENNGLLKVDRSDLAKAVNNVAIEPTISSKHAEDQNNIPGPPSPVLSVASSTGSTHTGFHKTQTRSGVRNLQDSSFKLTGEQVDDDKLGRTGIKVKNPPGGRSSGIW